MAPIWKLIRREPLVHFTILAGLLLAANSIWSDSERQVIRLDQTAKEALFKQREDLLLRPLTAQEREEVVESYIEDEILWHEARRRGLDSTSRIRRQLVQGMRFLLLAELSPPTEEDLRAFYEQDPSQFELPPSLTLDHVFFFDPDAVPEQTMVALQRGEDPETLGEFSMNLGPVIPWAGQERLVQIFGPDSARQILAIEDSDWHGPLSSNHGVHFVRITERHPGRVPLFEEIAPFIEGEWTQFKQREILDGEIEAMSTDYKIVIEERISATDE